MGSWRGAHGGTRGGSTVWRGRLSALWVWRGPRGPVAEIRGGSAVGSWRGAHGGTRGGSTVWRGRLSALWVWRGPRVPAVVQARREDTGRRPCPQALPRAGDAVCAVARLGHGSRRDEGPSAGAGRHPGPARAAGRDPCGSTSSGRTGCGLDGSSNAATRCRPRRLSAELGSGLAGWRGAADAPASQETAATLAYSEGSVRDDVAPCRRVARGGTASDGEGALRPSAAGAPGDVPRGPAPDSAAPRQGLAASRRPPSRVCRSDRSVPRRCYVTEPGRRFERRGFRLSAIDHAGATAGCLRAASSGTRCFLPSKVTR